MASVQQQIAPKTQHNQQLALDGDGLTETVKHLEDKLKGMGIKDMTEKTANQNSAPKSNIPISTALPFKVVIAAVAQNKPFQLQSSSGTGTTAKLHLPQRVLVSKAEDAQTATNVAHETHNTVELVTMKAENRGNAQSNGITSSEDEPK
jgi:hypothetical protein